MAVRRRPQASSGVLTAPGVTDAVRSGGPVLLHLGGAWSGEVVVEMSADDGASWVAAAQDDDSHPFTSPTSASVAVPDGTLVRMRAVGLSGELDWLVAS